MNIKKRTTIEYWLQFTGILVGWGISAYQIFDWMYQIHSIILKSVCITILCIGAVVVLVYIINLKIKEIKNKVNIIVECDRLPHQDRICKPVLDIINNCEYFQNTDRAFYKNIKEQKSFYQYYLDEIKPFIHKSRNKCIMTLPRDPYDQIKIPEVKDCIYDILDHINASDIPNDKREKYIVLSSKKLAAFQENLKSDILECFPKLAINTYLEKHKNKINIKWVYTTEQPEEFIIIDDSVNIIPSEDNSKIQVDVNSIRINNHINAFDSLKTHKPKQTIDFFNEYIFNSIFIDTDFLDKLSLKKINVEDVKAILAAG